MCNWQMTAIMNEQLETHYAWDVLTYSRMPSVFQRSVQALAQSSLSWKSLEWVGLGTGHWIMPGRTFPLGHFQLFLCNKTKCLWNENAAAVIILSPWQARGQGQGRSRCHKTAQDWASIRGFLRFWDQLCGLPCIISWAQPCARQCARCFSFIIL